MLLLLLLPLLALSEASDRCAVGGWGQWEPCVTPGSIEDKIPIRSWAAPATSQDEEAHARMLESMRIKDQYGAYLGECRRDGTCPELAEKRSSAPAECIDGMAGEWPCTNIDLVAHINVLDLGYNPSRTNDNSPRGNDIWGWTDPQDGYEYVIEGLTGASVFVRISPDPEQPEVLGILYDSNNRSGTWRDMKVKDHYVYIGSETSDHGMQVFDLTRLRGLDHNPAREFHPDAFYAEVGQSHNIVYNEGADYIYIVGSRHGNYPNVCNGGLHIVDISDPLNPTFVTCFGDDGYVHDAECVIYDGPDSRYEGHEICVCYNEDSLTIVDTSDKDNVDVISRREYEGSAYTHQGWFTEDKRWALMDDELDETRAPSGSRHTRTLLWDLQDLTNPILRSTYLSHHEAIDHNQYVLGDYTYQSNYRSGLQLMRIDIVGDAIDLEWVAEFDCHPSGTTAQFGGTWSNYPYFESGIVVLSSQEYGLFLLRPNWAAIEGQKKTRTCYQRRYREILSAADPASCPSVVDVRAVNSS